MSDTTTETRLKELFVRLFQVSAQSVKPETRRGQLERWDSLGHLELLEAIRTEFRVQIAPDQALAMETFADVNKIVGRLQTGE